MIEITRRVEQISVVVEEARTLEEVATTNRTKKDKPPVTQALKESAKISEVVAVDEELRIKAETRMTIINLSQAEVAVGVVNSKSLEKADVVAHEEDVVVVVAGTVTTTNATSSTKTETTLQRTP